MNDYITVVPAAGHRRRFAQWCLAQDQPLHTNGESSFGVPIDLYPDVPVELLSGALVDGFPFDHMMPQPEPESAPVAPSEPVTAPPEAEAPPRARKTRKRAPRKPVGAYTRKPSDVAAEIAAVVEASGGTDGAE